MEHTPDDARPKSSGRSRTKSRVWSIVAVLSVLASVVFIAPVSASHVDPPPGVEYLRTRADGTHVYSAPYLLIYTNETGEPNDLLVTVGGDLWEICAARPGNEGGAPAPWRMLVTERANGTALVKSGPAGHTTYVAVYRMNGMSVPEFFGATCGGHFGNGDPIKAPLATGTGTVHHKSWVRDVNEVLNDATPQPIGRYKNGVTAVVADADGNHFIVETQGIFRVTNPGDVPNFQVMTATMTPQAG